MAASSQPLGSSSSRSSSVLSAVSDDDDQPVVEVATDTADRSVDDTEAVEPRMTRKRKISNATTTRAATTNAAAAEKGKSSDVAADAGEGGSSDEDCPVCRMMPLEYRNKLRAKSVQWICCEECDTWFHWPCVKGEVPGKQGRVVPSDFEEWFCDKCIEKSIADEKRNPLASRMKEGTRKSARRKNETIRLQAGDAAAVAPAQGPAHNPWFAIAEAHKPTVDAFGYMRVEDLTPHWLERDPKALMQPFLIESPEGLDMKVLPADMQISEIADMVGRDRQLDVIDVASQSGLSSWTLGRWADYFDKGNRDKVRNVISLELSSSRLKDMVEAPKFVRDLDWVEQHWPEYMIEDDIYPQVMRYCLMSPGESWTDWHIDFSASSVFYHVLRGSKVFYFISPTLENLRHYERWSGAQNQYWLGEKCDKVYKMTIQPGNTAIIPSGWIHCVYTPTDSLVIGGNFLHSYNIAMQLRVYQIELNTKVPKKFRFPYFVPMLWYVGLDFAEQLASADHKVPRRILEGLKALSAFLLQQVWRISPDADVTAERRRMANENINWELIPDPDKLANDLQQRVYAALGEDVPPSPADGIPIFNAEDWLDEASIQAAVVPEARKYSRSQGSASKAKRNLNINAGSSSLHQTGTPAPKRKANGITNGEANGKVAKIRHANGASSGTYTTPHTHRANAPGMCDKRIEIRKHPKTGQLHEVEVTVTTSDKSIQKVVPGDTPDSWIVQTIRQIQMIERANFPANAAPITGKEGLQTRHANGGIEDESQLPGEEVKPVIETAAQQAEHLAENAEVGDETAKVEHADALMDASKSTQNPLTRPDNAEKHSFPQTAIAGAADSANDVLNLHLEIAQFLDAALVDVPMTAA